MTGTAIPRTGCIRQFVRGIILRRRRRAPVLTPQRAQTRSIALYYIHILARASVLPSGFSRALRAYYIYDVSIADCMYYDIYMIQYIVYVYVGLYNDNIILYLLCVIL